MNQMIKVIFQMENIIFEDSFYKATKGYAFKKKEKSKNDRKSKMV